MHIREYTLVRIHIIENTHYYARQFRIMTQTESASWSIVASKYALFS